MNLRGIIRDIIIGKGNFIATRALYKSAMLRGQLCILFAFVSVLYDFIDRSNGVTGFEIFYITSAVVALVAFWLNRIGKYTPSNLILIFMANLLVYQFASNDTYRAGTYIYFVITSLAALSLFGFQERRLGLSFCLLSLCLFIASYVFEIKLVHLSQEQAAVVYSEQYVRTTFITNFIIALTISVSIFYFLLDVNHYSENEILVKNEQLSKTNQELDRFVYSASHDLKAPLSSILGLIEIAQRTEDPEEVKTCLGMMKERVNNLDDFIKEIIDYSRNSRLELKKETFALLTLMKEVVDGLRYAEGFENIYIIYSIDSELEMVSDRSRLKVVLNNLIGNAFKYHDPDKENPLIEISANSESVNLKIEIKDNGLGIAPEHQAKVFDMFYRASEKSKGSGLGLYIVKETIEKMSGRISVESQLSKGTKFTVFLPMI
ncbi:MAG: sensor histidine kinase [Cyclobacteriaceae bacterium]